MAGLLSNTVVPCCTHKLRQLHAQHQAFCQAQMIGRSHGSSRPGSATDHAGATSVIVAFGLCLDSWVPSALTDLVACGGLFLPALKDVPQSQTAGPQLQTSTCQYKIVTVCLPAARQKSQHLSGGLLETVGVHCQLFVSIFAWKGIKVPNLLDVLAVPWRPRISNKYPIEREVLHDTGLRTLLLRYVFPANHS